MLINCQLEIARKNYPGSAYLYASGSLTIFMVPTLIKIFDAEKTFWDFDKIFDTKKTFDYLSFI